MYHTACKVEFQPFTRSYSQLTIFNISQKLCTGIKYTIGFLGTRLISEIPIAPLLHSNMHKCA